MRGTPVSMRRPAVLMFVYFAVIAGAATLAMLLPTWLPERVTVEGDRIDELFIFLTIMCIVILALVMAVVLYAAVHFRVRSEDDLSDGPPIHGHVKLEVAW